MGNHVFFFIYVWYICSFFLFYQQLKSMATKYQFLLISSPPNKEAVFKKAKAEHGSQFAFQWVIHQTHVSTWFKLAHNVWDTQYTIRKSLDCNNFFFCISGSNVENWHSILRKGLINATGSKLQVCMCVSMHKVSIWMSFVAIASRSCSWQWSVSQPQLRRLL